MESRISNIIVFITFITLVAFWIIAIFNVATSAMPYNSTSKQAFDGNYMFFRTLLPEGFSFFTRNPREPQLILIERKTQLELELRNNAPKYFFGFDRQSRALNVEISVIWSVVRSKKWYDCDNGDKSCLNESELPFYRINTSFSDPLLIGDYYLKVVEPTPWAWAEAFKRDNKSMPCKIIRVNITNTK